MTILNVDNLTKFFGTRLIFGAVSFTVGQGEKMAVVGRNGEGKTTLLRVLAGELDSDGGQFALVGRRKMGYLSQNVCLGQTTVLSAALSAKQDVAQLAGRMKQLEIEMSAKCRGGENKKDLSVLLDRYAKAVGRFEALGGYDLEYRAKSTLTGLGFGPEVLQREVSSLSGGEKVRLTLARLLLAEPDLLLLDEPTNHLDLAGVDWLESFLGTYPGAVLTASHDRYFVDRVARKVLELDRGKGKVYSGNYSAYIRLKEAENRLQQEAYFRQQELIVRTKKLIRKWKGTPTRVGMARSREKMLNRLEIVEKPQKAKKPLRLRFDVQKISGDEVLRITGLSKRFPEAKKDGQKASRCLFRDFSWLCKKGERIALVGPNGCGKTTLLRCLTGIDTAYAGTVQYGAGIILGYFSQNLDDLDDASTVLQEVRSLGLTLQESRDLCGRFLFSGEDMEKKVGTLSGGERTRIALAKLMVGKGNLLFLDEPTNHLDMASKEVLEEALKDFPGTIIIASHDRYFIDFIATHLWVFQDETIHVFAGGYSDWKRQAASGMPVAYEEELPSFKLLRGTPIDSSGHGGAKTGVSVRTRSEKPVRQGKKTGVNPEQPDLHWKRELKISEVETKIDILEKRRFDMMELFKDPASYRDPADLPWKEFKEVEQSLEKLYEKWVMLHGEEPAK